MIDNDERLAIIDAEHLRLLGRGYYLSAGIAAFFSLFGLLYMALIGGVIFLIMVVIAGVKAYVGWCLEQRRQRILCLVVGAVSCLEVPYGTALGICTFIVLMRPRVMRQFDGTPEPRASWQCHLHDRR
jgi:hypothetical protein